MKKFFKALVLSLAVMFLAVGCTTFKAESMAWGHIEGQRLGDFKKTVTVWKFLGTSGGATLFNISQNQTPGVIENAIHKEVEKLGGNAAVNVTIEQKVTVGNSIINALTFSIAAPCKVVVKGTAVKM